MELPFQTSSSSMSLSARLFFIATSVLSAAVMLKLSAPAIADFTVYEVPSLYNGVVSWLRPPYLYLVINCIIITILASSKLQSKNDDVSVIPQPHRPLEPSVPLQPQPLPTMSVQTYYPGPEYKYGDVVFGDCVVKEEKGLDFETEVPDHRNDATVPFAGNTQEDATGNKENEFVLAKSMWNYDNATDNRDLKEYSPSAVKPPVSARFGHRRNVKASPEGVKTVLGVSKPKRQDTLESTWKTITEGRSMPLTRHLRKSDTWERDSHGQGHGSGSQYLLQPNHDNKTPQKMMKKADTFHDRTNARTLSPGSSGGSGKLKREPSLTQDELNRRVEAFIKKFNEDMRLQRQESLNQYMEMIKRGSH